MAYVEVSRVEIQEVLRRWQAGEHLRAIARSTGLSRATVQKYARAAEAVGLERHGPAPTEAQVLALVQQNLPGPRQVAAPSRDTLTPFAERIQQWVQTDRGRLYTMPALLEIVRRKARDGDDVARAAVMAVANLLGSSAMYPKDPLSADQDDVLKQAIATFRFAASEATPDVREAAERISRVIGVVVGVLRRLTVSLR